MRLEDDAIVDLCKPAPKALYAAGGAGGTGDGMARAAALARGGAAGAGGVGGASNGMTDEDIFPKPTLGSSWLSWKDSITLEVNSNVLPVVTLSVNPPDANNDLFGGLKSTQVSSVDRPGGDVQRRKQSAYIIYEGNALRLGFPVPIPTLLKWGNVKLVPANRKDRDEGFTTSVVGNAGYAIFAAKWKLRFFVPELPS